ncbi:hypothetical protein BD410DRAFT_286560 [Rickenella mellea]|uniref:Uncharacterized protein n=1 Tax=Rickenella mellea TaxID=50990 RepID=A0A4Y7Q417_9AGAM|nr:hypothetical protein BD410DRAFT_286560 [Rickenella mellea]
MFTIVKPLIPAPIRRYLFIHINDLPIELLPEIFLWCNPISTFPRPSRHRAPILLGRVCRVWRSVSFKTPQLWADITIGELKWSTGPSVPWNSRLFDEWLRRSGNCPLSFTIKDHDADSHEAFTLNLQAEAHRWKSVGLETDCDCADDILRTLRIPGMAPMLIELCILRRSFKNRMLIHIASQLRSLYVCLDSERSSFDCGFHSLRELRIGRCRSSHYFHSYSHNFRRWKFSRSNLTWTNTLHYMKPRRSYIH